ncbi:TetR-like C-terminal domain-containing protein [Streptomyces filamentosus]|uniref:TetR-like C-terminal domain-containing protein n=1 Tax=Streptomyces filamentosus TaxID=67294 RepID=UPI0037D6FC71
MKRRGAPRATPRTPRPIRTRRSPVPEPSPQRTTEGAAPAGRSGGFERRTVPGGLRGGGPRGGPAGDGIRDERLRRLRAVLDRARERGEEAPGAPAVLDHVLAPMYIRVLFGLVPLAPDHIDGLVDRLP